MKQNPVYNREMRVSSRSMKLPLIIFLFNGILFLVTLLNMYSVIMQVKASASIQYSSFMDLYEFVTSMEFLLLMFIVPAVTASSISGERERHTLELMFTTKIRPVDIVIGKLASAFTHLMILVFSSLPVLMLTFIYGSISSQDLFLLLFSYVQLTTISQQVVELRSEMTALQSEEAKLRTAYELSYDLSSIEETMTASGAMVRPQNGQVVYVDLSEPDTVTFFNQDEAAAGLDGMFESVKSIASEIVAYFQ